MRDGYDREGSRRLEVRAYGPRYEDSTADSAAESATTTPSSRRSSRVVESFATPQWCSRVSRQILRQVCKTRIGRRAQFRGRMRLITGLRRVRPMRECGKTPNAFGFI